MKELWEPMAHDFLGTFKLRDLESFETFAQSELDKSQPMINHLIFERNRLKKMLDRTIEVAQDRGIDPIIWKNEIARLGHYPWFDRDAGLYIQRIKEPLYQNIKVIERIEHRIRKLVDRMEQLEERVARMKFTNFEFKSDIESVRSLFDGSRPYLEREG